MTLFYWYSGVVLFLGAVAVLAIFRIAKKSTAKDPSAAGGILTFTALTAPWVILWFIALGWTIAILYRRHAIDDPTLADWTYYLAIAVGFGVIKSPFDAYRNFITNPRRQIKSE